MPGLFVDAASPAAALAVLAPAVGAEHAWLAAHGLTLPYAAELVEVEEAERLELETDVDGGQWRGLFRYELRPTTETDVSTTLERARWAREDLLALLGGAESANARGDALRAHADHEWWLLSRLGSRLEGELPADPLERLSFVRARTEERLTHLLPGDRERLAVFDGEKWTTRKVLRCLVVAERELLARVRAAVAQPTGHSN